jgi:cellulose synthase/poly-beta-1,6-N-acetylglucosamine synthase-like glycosyltransferase
MIVLEVILLVYFFLVTFYTLILAVAGHFTVDPYKGATDRVNKIAVLIPSYKEDAVIYHTAASAIKQNYPMESFHVVVIADSLKESTVKELKKLPINVVEVEFEQSTKVKSLNMAMKEIGDDFDIVLILDADNVMEIDFLSKINKAYNAGHHAIQGRRVAKNMNTPFAVLDTISEVINNHVYRKGQVALGLSSAVIGSGMAFEYASFKKILGGIHAVGGFDRVVEMNYIERGYKIAYLHDAIVYDEKVDNPVHFQNQRKRWLSSQFVYLRKYFGKGVKLLFQGNFDYFNLAIIHTVILPRILNLGLLVFLFALSYVVSNFLSFGYEPWGILLAVFMLTFFISIPANLYNAKLFKAMLYVPQAFFILFLSLFKLKGANKKFIHTPHTSVEVDKSLTEKK